MNAMLVLFYYLLGEMIRRVALNVLTDDVCASVAKTFFTVTSFTNTGVRTYSHVVVKGMPLLRTANRNNVIPIGPILLSLYRIII